jgi:kynurenine 3-monooxygenase
MNAGLEDVRVLFDLLDTHCVSASPSPPSSPRTPPPTTQNSYSPQRATALSHYSHRRAPDAAAINDLALQNYVEMRSSVISPLYLLRKRLEELLSAHVPSLGWQTKYALVSFGNERYSEVMKRNERQGRVLVGALAMALAIVVGGLGTLVARIARWKWRARGKA